VTSLFALLLIRGLILFHGLDRTWFFKGQKTHSKKICVFFFLLFPFVTTVVMTTKTTKFCFHEHWMMCGGLTFICLLLVDRNYSSLSDRICLGTGLCSVIARKWSSWEKTTNQVLKYFILHKTEWTLIKTKPWYWLIFIPAVSGWYTLTISQILFGFCVWFWVAFGLGSRVSKLFGALTKFDIV
jgi:hypothetical protein